MPDFLHDAVADSASEASTPNPQTKPAVPTVQTREGVDRADVSSHEEKAPRNPGRSNFHQKDKGYEKRKEPLPIFTHYYGVFFLCLIALFLGGGYALLAPRYASMTTVWAESGSLAETLANEQQYLNALNNSIASAEAIPKDVLQRVDEAMPSDDSGIPKLLVTMSTIAQQSGVSLGSIQFSPGSAVPSSAPGTQISVVPTRISTNITAKGYQAMRRFLTNLEQSLRLIDINSINVSASSQTEKTDGESSSANAKAPVTEYSYALQMTAYHLEKGLRTTHQPAAIPPTPTPASAEETTAP